MRALKRTPDTSAPPLSSGLEALISAEQRLQQVIERAAAEAEDLVAQAHARARARDEEAARDLQQRVAALEREAAVHRLEALRTLAERSARERARYRELDEGIVAELAEHVADRVLESFGAPAEVSP